MYTLSREKIHQSMMVNADQTGLVLVPGGNDPTYKVKGSKQELIHGNDKKRAFTCVTVISGQNRRSTCHSKCMEGKNSVVKTYTRIFANSLQFGALIYL